MGAIGRVVSTLLYLFSTLPNLYTLPDDFAVPPIKEGTRIAPVFESGFGHVSLLAP